MGRDYEFVAYQGTPLADAELARVLRRAVPGGELFRHSLGREVWSRKQKAPLADLNCVAVYEQAMGASSRTGAGARGVYISAGKLAEAQHEAMRGDRSLASMVQTAVKLMRAELARLPPPPPPGPGEDDNPMLELARELSRTSGEAFWLLQGDHSGIGGYARFKDGTLVDPASTSEVFVEPDRGGVPDHKWSAALGVAVTLDEVMGRYFPDRQRPPLRDVEDPARTIPFDGARYDIALG